MQKLTKITVLKKLFSLICLISLLINNFYVFTLESKAQSSETSRVNPEEIIIKDSSLSNNKLFTLSSDSASISTFSISEGQYFFLGSFKLGKTYDTIEAINYNEYESYLILSNKKTLSSSLLRKDSESNSYSEVLDLKGINAESVFLSDLNQDGFLDCVVKKNANSIYLNNEGTSFTQTISTDYDDLIGGLTPKEAKPELSFPLAFQYDNEESGTLKLQIEPPTTTLCSQYGGTSNISLGQCYNPSGGSNYCCKIPPPRECPPTHNCVSSSSCTSPKTAILNTTCQISNQTNVCCSK